MIITSTPAEVYLERIWKALTGQGDAESGSLTDTLETTKDGGEGWVSVFRYTTSADMTTAAALTLAPTAGQRLVITDILISSDTAMLFEFEEETSGTVIGAVRLSVDSPVQITPRSKWKLPVADRRLFGDAGAAGNVYITVWWYSEA